MKVTNKYSGTAVGGPANSKWLTARTPKITIPVPEMGEIGMRRFGIGEYEFTNGHWRWMSGEVPRVEARFHP